MDNLKLKDLLNIEILQNIQESFLEYTGIVALVTDENGVPFLDRKGKNSDFCFRLTRRTKEGDLRCRICDMAGLEQAKQTGKPAVYICHAGLVDFAIPIVLEGRVIGGIIAGQVCPETLDKAKLRKTATELGIDPEEYIKAAEETLHLSYEQVEKAAEFLYQIAKNIAAMAYENYCINEQVRKLEQAKLSNANFMLSTGAEFSTEMKTWLNDIKNVSKSLQNDPETSNKLEGILFTGQKLSSMISGATDYMYSSEGTVNFSGSAYSARDVISDNVLMLQELAEKRGVTLSLSFDDDLPELFLGNSGRIGLLVNKIVLDCINNAAADRRLDILTGSRQQLYCTELTIKITGSGENLNEELIDGIIRFKDSQNPDDANENVQNLDIPMLISLIQKMSGKVDMKKIDNHTFEIDLAFPQLTGNA